MIEFYSKAAAFIAAHPYTVIVLGLATLTAGIMAWHKAGR